MPCLFLDKVWVPCSPSLPLSTYTFPFFYRPGRKQTESPTIPWRINWGHCPLLPLALSCRASPCPHLLSWLSACSSSVKKAALPSGLNFIWNALHSSPVCRLASYSLRIMRSLHIPCPVIPEYFLNSSPRRGSDFTQKIHSLNFPDPGSGSHLIIFPTGWGQSLFWGQSWPCMALLILWAGVSSLALGTATLLREF